MAARKAGEADERQYGLRLSTDLLRRLHLAAFDQGVSVAELVRRYLAEGLEHDARRQAAGE